MSDDIWSVKRILDWIEGYLDKHGDENPRYSAQWLVADALDCSRMQLFLDLERPLTLAERETLREYTRRRGAGEPLQYISGKASFRHIEVKVAPGVLIPRPETEVLVSEALSLLPAPEKPQDVYDAQILKMLQDDENPDSQFATNAVDDPQRELLVADICTGTSCIASSIAYEHPNTHVIATDISPVATALARENVKLLGLDKRVSVIECDLGTGIDESLLGSFDLVVSNPPYSIKWAGSDNPLLINDPRFSPAGVLAPKSKADLAFIMHSLSWLATNGTAAIVCFPGIMYRGGAEKKIRQYLIDNNFVDCVIQLPSNLFFGTSIATCIMVLKKSKSDNSVLFIDATKECVKVTNNNRLTEENIKTIVDCFASREDRQYFAHLAEYSEIEENGYNLSVSTYVEQEDTREVIDIEKLNAEIAGIVAREEVLRAEIDKIIAEIEGGQADDETR